MVRQEMSDFGNRCADKVEWASEWKLLCYYSFITFGKVEGDALPMYCLWVSILRACELKSIDIVEFRYPKKLVVWLFAYVDFGQNLKDRSEEKFSEV